MTMHLTVIAKAPVPGRVKTRLCPPCTPEQAAQLAAIALHETLDAVVAVTDATAVRRVLLLDGDAPAWVPPCFEIVEQSTGTLADRLADGFRRLGPGVMVGMDTPGALAGLAGVVPMLQSGCDVLGPALDGGYWSIGLSAVDEHVFDGIEMSTARTGADQLGRLRSLGRRVSLLQPARDLDVFDDVRALARTDHRGRTAAWARTLVAAVDGAMLQPID